MSRNGHTGRPETLNRHVRFRAACDVGCPGHAQWNFPDHPCPPPPPCCPSQPASAPAPPPVPPSCEPRNCPPGWDKIDAWNQEYVEKGERCNNVGQCGPCTVVYTADDPYTICCAPIPPDDPCLDKPWKLSGTKKVGVKYQCLYANPKLPRLKRPRIGPIVKDPTKCPPCIK